MSDLPPVDTPPQEETPATTAPAANPKATDEKNPPLEVYHIVLIVFGSVLLLAGLFWVWRTYYGKKDTILSTGLSNQYNLQPPPSIASGLSSSTASSVGPAVSTYTLTPPPMAKLFSPSRTGGFSNRRLYPLYGPAR
jgi:hypothetical protein